MLLCTRSVTMYQKCNKALVGVWGCCMYQKCSMYKKCLEVWQLLYVPVSSARLWQLGLSYSLTRSSAMGVWRCSTCYMFLLLANFDRAHADFLLNVWRHATCCSNTLFCNTLTAQNFFSSNKHELECLGLCLLVWVWQLELFATLFLLAGWNTPVCCSKL